MELLVVGSNITIATGTSHGDHTSTATTSLEVPSPEYTHQLKTGGSPLRATASTQARSKEAQNAICSTASSRPDPKLWVELCKANYWYKLDQLLQINQRQPQAKVVQIGAHVGFGKNDPISDGLLEYLNNLPTSQRKKFQWNFVEPSTANYKALQKRLLLSGLGAELRPIHAAVVGDDAIDTEEMIFYSIRDTIDPLTGLDSLSGKTFPVKITQLAGFSMVPFENNEQVWVGLGLNMLFKKRSP
jgi:hypothetical protein